MKIKTYYTKLSFKEAVKYYKAQGYKFLGYTWDCACFENLILVRKF